MVADRSHFAHEIAKLKLSHTDRAVAFLYYYRESQEYEERSVSELADDLAQEGFPKPNVTRLREGLTRSNLTVRGSKPRAFKIDLRQLEELSKLYGDHLSRRRVDVSNHVVPPNWVQGTRTYLERMVYQINVSYEFGMYDACAVMLRRLMESLIIEVYIHNNRHHEIQKNGVFFMLDRLISFITSDNQISLSRNSPKTMREIKQLGDTAAHDRTYVTPSVDIDDTKARSRRLIQELITKAGITS